MTALCVYISDLRIPNLHPIEGEVFLMTLAGTYLLTEALIVAGVTWSLFTQFGCLVRILCTYLPTNFTLIF